MRNYIVREGRSDATKVVAMQSDTLSERATQTERVALSERVWPLLVVALGVGLTVAWIIFLADEIGRLFRLS